MKSLGLTICLFMTCALLSRAGELRTWTSTDGHTLQATLVGFDSTNVTLKLANGQASNVPVSRLSATDQTFVKSQPTQSKAQTWPTLVKVTPSAVEANVPATMAASGGRPQTLAA